MGESGPDDAPMPAALIMMCRPRGAGKRREGTKRARRAAEFRRRLEEAGVWRGGMSADRPRDVEAVFALLPNPAVTAVPLTRETLPAAAATAEPFLRLVVKQAKPGASEQALDYAHLQPAPGFPAIPPRQVLVPAQEPGGAPYRPEPGGPTPDLVTVADQVALAIACANKNLVPEEGYGFAFDATLVSQSEVVFGSQPRYCWKLS
ncbi:unnamed protein product [Pedinophyceae sp. YPF-701]|nr:unnamed protein product [Pedinophyceae sp. YPF-701]